MTVKRPAAPEPVKVHPKVVMLYEGSFTTLKDAQAFRWRALPDDWRKASRVEETWTTRTYVKKPSTLIRAGNVYEFAYPEADPTSLFLNTARYLGVFPVQAEVARLQAQDDGERAAWELRKSEKRQKGRKVYLEVLEPLRLAYWSLGPTERTVLVSKVVKAMTGHRPLRTARANEEDDA